MTQSCGWLVHRYDTVASTMDQAAHLARFGARDRTVVVSAEQTDGRGRSGRSWQCPAGTGLFCTIILRPRVAPDRLSTLPLVSGLAVAEAIDHVTGRSARLKWPNDVWIGEDRERPKVAGILVTSSLQGSVVDRVLVGIGINVSAGTEDLPPGATSVLAATGVATTPDDVFNVLLARFDTIYAEYLATGGRPSLESWRARAVLRGELVTIEDAGREVTGVFVDIDEDGGLLLQEPDLTIHKLVVGDLVRGPRAFRHPG